jgi:hypothetical protein
LYTAITTSLDDQVAVIELNRPPANYFDTLLIGEIVDAADAGPSVQRELIPLFGQKSRRFIPFVPHKRSRSFGDTLANQARSSST